MIRQMARATGNLVRFSLILCIAVIRMPPLLAAPVEAWDLSAPVAPAGTQASPVSTAQINEVRSEALRFQSSSDPRQKQRGARLALWLDILTAKTSDLRHAAVRRLPVKVVQSNAVDGRVGTIQSFVARGKVRVERFVAVLSLTSSTPDIQEQAASGPNVPAARADCTYDGYTGECATQQEIEDAFIVIAEAEAENEWQKEEYEEAYAELQAYCNSYPSQCEGIEAGELVPSGPHACVEVGSCGYRGLAALSSVLGAMASASAAVVVASAVAPPAVPIAIVVTGAVAATVASVAAVGLYLDCKIEQMGKDLAPNVAWDEPVY